MPIINDKKLMNKIMNSKKWLFSLCGLVMLFSFNANAQQLLTLEQVLQIAYENSPSIVESKLSLVQSRESLNAQKASLKSRFSLDVTPFSYSHDREFNDLMSTWYTSESMGSSGTFSIVQPIKATDGTISLVNRFSWQDYTNDYSNVSSNTFSNSLQLQIEQPLFKYNETKMNLTELELDLENTLISYSLQKLTIESQVTQYFYQVYQAQQSLLISQDELENQQKTYDITTKKVEAGLMAKEELWQADLNLANARSEVYNAEVTLEDAKDQLKQTIGMNLDSSFNIIANVVIDTVNVQLQDAVDYALKQRMEIRQREISIQNSQFDLIQTKATNKFNGSVSLAVGLVGENESFGRIYDSPTNNQQIGITFEIPLWDWGERRSRIKAAEASLKSEELSMEQEKVDIELNIRQVFRSLNNQVNQIKIAEKNVENAKLTYELNLEKYENGDLTGMDLNDYQSQLSSSKNELTNALISYKLELLNLKIQTLWDFEKHQTIVPSEYSSEFQK